MGTTKKKKWIAISGALLGVCATAGGAWWALHAKHAPHVNVVHEAKAETAPEKATLHEGDPSKVFATLQAKLDELGHALEENEKLKRENHELELKLQNVEYGCSSRQAKAKTQSYELKLSKETGAQVGRTLAAISFQVPTHLMPEQMYRLALSYFKVRDDEKAAVILSYLTQLDENGTYKTPEIFLLTAIAWYRLDNFDVADGYLEHVLKAPEEKTNLPFQAQARLWKALIAHKQNDHSKSQHWLRDLMDHHPHSDEATWINEGVTAEATPEIEKAEKVEKAESQREPAEAAKPEAEHAHE